MAILAHLIKIPLSVRLLFLSEIFQLSNALPWSGPDPTIRYTPDDLIPQPTSKPQPILELMKRDYYDANVCGWIDGDKYSPALCSGNTHCVWDTKNTVVGCCPNDGPCINDIYTSCVDVDRPDQTATSANVLTCSGANVCYINSYEGGYYSYGCGALNQEKYIASTFEDQSDTVLQVILTTFNFGLSSSASKTASRHSGSKPSSSLSSASTPALPPALVTHSATSAAATVTSSTSSSKKTGIIIGSIIGALGAVFAVSAIACLSFRRRYQRHNISGEWRHGQDEKDQLFGNKTSITSSGFLDPNDALDILTRGSTNNSNVEQVAPAAPEETMVQDAMNHGQPSNEVTYLASPRNHVAQTSVLASFSELHPGQAFPWQPQPSALAPKSILLPSENEQQQRSLPTSEVVSPLTPPRNLNTLGIDIDSSTRAKRWQSSVFQPQYTSHTHILSVFEVPPGITNDTMFSYDTDISSSLKCSSPTPTPPIRSPRRLERGYILQQQALLARYQSDHPTSNLNFTQQASGHTNSKFIPQSQIQEEYHSAFEGSRNMNNSSGSNKNSPVSTIFVASNERRVAAKEGHKVTTTNESISSQSATALEIRPRSYVAQQFNSRDRSLSNVSLPDTVTGMGLGVGVEPSNRRPIGEQWHPSSMVSDWVKPLRIVRRINVNEGVPLLAVPTPPLMRGQERRSLIYDI